MREKHDRYGKIAEVEKRVVEHFTAPYLREKVALDSLEAVEARRDGLRKLSVDREGRAPRAALRADARAAARRRRAHRRPRAARRAPDRLRGARGARAPTARRSSRAARPRRWSTRTLGSPGDAQTIDAMTERSYKRFMLHYNFPPFSVGEARFLRGPSRRDIGHGNLAERAIQAVLPPDEDFPYTRARRLRGARVERLVLDGDGLRRDALAARRRRRARRRRSRASRWASSRTATAA